MDGGRELETEKWTSCLHRLLLIRQILTIQKTQRTNSLGRKWTTTTDIQLGRMKQLRGIASVKNWKATASFQSQLAVNSMEQKVLRQVVHLQMAKLAREQVGQRLVATVRLRCLYIVPGKLGRVGLLSELQLQCFKKWEQLWK